MSVLESRARSFAATYKNRPPSRTTGTWANCCGILMIMFGGYLGGLYLGKSAQQITAQIANDGRPWWKKAPVGNISSAQIVADQSKPLNTAYAKAPIGAFHFWAIGKDGHVGLDLRGGGSMVFMASTFCAASWGSDIGINNVQGYTATAKAKYLGWSTAYSQGTMYLPSEAPTVAPNQRQVLSTAAVKRRAKPNVNDSTNPGIDPPTPASTVTTPLGWINGDSGTQPAGGGPWFQNADKTYSHSSGFTDKGTHDLADLNIAPPPPQFVITFDAAGGEPVPDPQTIPLNGRVTEPPDPVKDGFTFQSWNDVLGAWDFANDPVTQAETLTAMYEAIPIPPPDGDGTLTPETIAAIVDAVDAKLAPRFQAISDQIAALPVPPRTFVAQP